MYNLFVTTDENAWQGTPFDIEFDRCLREYTNTEFTQKFGELTAAQVNDIIKLPCIFAYEAFKKKDPKFGVIRDVRRRGNDVRVDYEIIYIRTFISHTDFKDLASELDISKWELNRTHWALKDVKLGPVLRARGVTLPHWAVTMAQAVDFSNHKFDVALSFPDEVRTYVEAVAQQLENLIWPNSYFYDNNYVSQLARPCLDILLQGIYRNQSNLVVVFLCSDYQRKQWCGIEFQAIREIILKKNHDQVMFIRMDDGDVDGVFDTDGYIDGRRFGPLEVALFILERIEIMNMPF